VAVTDFLDEKRREITERLKELRPLVEEFNRLEAAAIALAGAVGSAASKAGRAVGRGRGRPRGATSSAPTPAETSHPVKARAARKPAGRPAKRRAGTRKGSGTRAAEALSLVQGHPGITTPELAARMGISPNYLYRVLPGLQKEGAIRKDGRGWHAKAS
jgi:hypothetical protein